MELPGWLQFWLTLAGGWMLGLGTAWLAVFRRFGRVESRLQRVEQTVYGTRDNPQDGLVAKQAHNGDGIARVEKLLIRICQKLNIPDGLD